MISVSPSHILLEAALAIERLVPREDAGRQSTNQMHTTYHNLNKYCLALSTYNIHMKTTFKIILQVYLNNGFSQGLYTSLVDTLQEKNNAG